MPSPDENTKTNPDNITTVTPSNTISTLPSSGSGTIASAKRPSRNIVLLLDGTANQFSAKNSNVIKLMSVLQVDERQLIYYSSGIGTILPTGAGTWSWLKQEAAKAKDMGFATNFSTFVCDAYKFLMDYYQSGDKVYLFGFSRGAYTARTLAGMIQKIGLLPPGNHNQIELAWGVYTNPEGMAETGGLNPEQSISILYRRIFGISRPVSIHFVGVWDTVASLGGLRAEQMEFAAGVNAVTFFRHALALNERRSAFVQENRVLDEDEVPVDPTEVIAAKEELNALVDHPKHRTISDKGKTGAKRPSHPRTVTEAQLTEGIQAASPPIVALCDPEDCYSGVERKNVECWFMGCHSDVGGGNTLNGEKSLSNVPFRWMLREAEGCGLRFDPAGIALQNALNKVDAVRERDLIPQGLIDLLNKDLYNKGPKRSSDQIAKDTAEVERYIRDHIQPNQIRAILHAAADSDSAEWDAADKKGGAMNEDMLQPITESLKGAWNLMEPLTFERTRADPRDPGSEGSTEWTTNWWGGRQIAQGQSIHYSVLKRLRHDTDLNKKDSAKYGIPPAKLPKEWDVTWEGLVRGDGPDIWEA